MPARLVSDELIKGLHQSFRGVSRAAGVSLHETEVLDRHGSAGERTAARERDKDQRWEDVLELDLESVQGIGGPAFMDATSVKYYTPAYLRYWLRCREKRVTTQIMDSFVSILLRDVDSVALSSSLFNAEQGVAIALCLYKLAVEYQEQEARRALAIGFHHYLPSHLKTKKWAKIRAAFLDYEYNSMDLYRKRLKDPWRLRKD